MAKYTWKAKVDHPECLPGHGNGTVEADTENQALRLVSDHVSSHGDGRASARDITLTPEQ
jgi:hypothetical protein